MTIRLKRGDRLVLATHNKGKLLEFQDMLADFGLDIVSAGELGLPEPEETGTTFVENARLKAHAAAKATGEIALSDDSGISVDALDGQPGVYTADWAGVPRNFTNAMQKVQDLLGERPSSMLFYASPCPTALTCCSRASRRAPSSGRRSAIPAMATTRCSNPTGMRRPSGR